MVTITNLAYLISAILFILGLKGLSSPRTARRGNLLAAMGMLVAVVVTLFDRQIINFTYIIAGIAIGGSIGAISAWQVPMTAMPQMVAVLNGSGGGASAMVAVAEFLRMTSQPGVDVSVTLVLSLLIGTVTLTGSLIAAGKLQGVLRGAPVVFPFQQTLSLILLSWAIVLGVLFVISTPSLSKVVIIALIGAVLGVLTVIPIGGADMPVVISLLNSYSGLAAAMTGFVLSNNVLIISGALVGASGLILTNLMCKAMNRNLGNVLFGRVGVEEGGPAGVAEQRRVISHTAEDAATLLGMAHSVIIVPGYGLAVAQAQYTLQELAAQLAKRGINVRYAIHPVAGRMPGHMNVLLAEANVPYDLLYEMDAINDDFQRTDVALVVGANDVINPAARNKKGCPLYGMPILNVDKARTVIICKRSLRPGFSGEDNEIFYLEKTLMVFGDAKDTLTKIVSLVKES
ncbi:MAG TPA: NAD(P)(+) transhydrogenase (Re/Si-specific) subunit beta [Candidatus Tripitaka californicus]|uniref:NAD(P)(+) transhydrogenase (Re/Si-specific) subunit beta n=1 Tax=Candidatus Tripitaka californicus TaxID=3367616 RepID=UPI00402A122A|nr:NAD(P)(+) transhydrogenase (Re/Si-specific) subunit beta [Planctomycetota bacterium]